MRVIAKLLSGWFIVALLITAASLRAELAAWQKEVGAKFPSPNPNFDATKPNARGAKRNP